jgi:outer membrane lipopolysaccharide assembly protein LptE/RlpB
MHSLLKTTRLTRSLLAIFFVGLITSCGFHLRGQGLGDWPATSKQFAVVDQTSQIFWLRLLLPALKQLGITIDDTSQRQLILNDSSTDKVIASYDTSGRAAQYTITEKISFSFHSPIAAEKLTRTQLSQQRTYNFNANNLSGKTQEERLIQQELRQQLTQQLLLRLQQHLSQSATNNTQTVPPTAQPAL